MRKELEEDIYDRGNSSFTSESRLSSKYENEEEFRLVESDDEIMSRKEELKQNTSDQLTTKQQLLKTFIDKVKFKNRNNIKFKNYLNKNVLPWNRTWSL